MECLMVPLVALVFSRQPADVSLALREAGGFVIRSTSANRYVLLMKPFSARISLEQQQQQQQASIGGEEMQLWGEGQKEEKKSRHGNWYTLTLSYREMERETETYRRKGASESRRCPFTPSSMLQSLEEDAGVRLIKGSTELHHNQWRNQCRHQSVLHCFENVSVRCLNLVFLKTQQLKVTLR